MMDAGRHPNITLMSYSEVIALEGDEGDFSAVVRRHPRYVKEEICTGCGLCEQVCPVVAPNPFDMGLKASKAIYRPFPQSVPVSYTIDKENCLNDEFIVCERCYRSCDLKAIDYDMQTEDIRLNVGSVIVAVGFDEYNPVNLRSFGFGHYPNVLTALEFERMLNASGATQGHIVRPSDMKPPKNIVFVQCVGARGEGRPYCSRYCCMNAVKDSMLVKQHLPSISKMTILYTDIRAFGKGFDAFHQRSTGRKDIEYIRGRPSKIVEVGDTGRLEVLVENTISSDPLKLETDMVVLSSSAVPSADVSKLAGVLDVETDEHGFFRRSELHADPILSSRKGIFLAGGSAGPLVIPEAVAQASASATRSAAYMLENKIEREEEEIRQVDVSGPPRVGVIVCHCGVNIAGLLDVEELMEYARTLPNVAYANHQLFSCSDGSQREIQELILEHNLNRLVVAACTPRTHEPVFQKACAEVGLNPYMFEMVNIRDQCSWVHANTPEKAQLRARDQIRMGVARARHLEPLERTTVGVKAAALVVGAGVAGLTAALDLDALGIETHLIEKEADIGGTLNDLDILYPGDTPASELLDQLKNRLKESSVSLYTGATFKSVDGYVGNFKVDVEIKGKGKKKPSGKTFEVGSIILATGAGLYEPAKNEYGFGKFTNVVTSSRFEAVFKDPKEWKATGAGDTGIAVFIQCVGSRDDEVNPVCSRYCCPATVRQAIQLADKGHEAVVLYRDMRMVSAGAEELYREARGKGVIFLKYSPERKPEVKGKGKLAGSVVVFDELLNKEIAIPTNLVVLAVGMVPAEPVTTELQQEFKIPRGLDGYFIERHPELGPVETTSEGVFICGTVQAPKDISDSMAQASAAAAKAAAILMHDHINLDAAVCDVTVELCRACNVCVEICQFNAPELAELNGRMISKINRALCKGCGTCASWCPTGAIRALHFTESQIESMIDAALSEMI